MRKLLYISLLAWSLWACKSNKSLIYQNVAQQYQQETVLMRPEFTIQHLNDSVSRLYYMVNAHDLLYARITGTDTFKAQLRISYSLYNSLEESEVLTSDTLYFSDHTLQPKDKRIEGYIDIATTGMKSGLILLNSSDLNRDFHFRSYVFIERKSDIGRQSFNIYTSNGRICYSPYFRVGQSIYLTHQNPRDSIYVRYYNRDFPLAAPPYIIQNDQPFNYRPDSSYRIAFTDTLALNQRGFYHLQFDTATTEGVTVFAFYAEFPHVSKAEHLIPPMRYITTQKEYAAMTGRKEVEEFWLQNSGSPDRARVLIKTYYNRAVDANKYFSSYMEGWKTDRGIVFVIFGPPNIIYRTTNSETWIYGEENSMLSYNFTFVRVDNPFTSNDFALNRSSVYRYSWSQAVDTWRQGRIFNVTNVQRAQDETRRQFNRPYFWY